MTMHVLVLFFLFIHVVVRSEVMEGLRCSVIDPVKVCFLDSCPESEGVCIRQDGGKYCCQFQNLILPEVPRTTEMTTTMTTSEVCEDRSPRCVTSLHMCSMPDYDDIMNVYCQKTCGRPCGDFTLAPPVTGCRDVTPDCVGKEALCTMTGYVAIMEHYCPRSCGVCT
ncbi:hypothetical protein PMAYCL1PPCAC_15324 [Pristionchus mayeri]|uniref:ShKT domain-containing protein n=1 Tax=Pristionchus mayeri TaxID=1317129 RepID=A0AAN5CIN1_9BILA|nr:hypothetical protein PMAYCL1PPCAC_15324 [Pristionchus mayeri]